MKYQSILLPLTMFILTGINGCTKNDNPNGTDTFSHRIISEKSYSDDILKGEVLYEYSGSKITKCSSTYLSGAIAPGGDVSVSKITTFQYPDKNSITGTYTLKYDGVIQSVSDIEIKLVNDKVTEIIEGEDRITVTYNSSGQIEERTEYESDRLSGNATYSYSLGKLIEMLNVSYEGSSVYQNKYLYTYNGDEVDELTELDKEGGIWVPSGKKVFTYTDGRITKIQNYYYQNDSWLMSPYYEECKYDSFGNLTEYSAIYTENVTHTSKIKYTYEKGSGNYRQIFDAGYYSFTEPRPNKKSTNSKIMFGLQGLVF
jgi:hypothetical protein